jgi:hypothetical protein
MTRTDILTELRRLEQHFDDRVEIWRVIINADGTEVGRIYRGSFYQPRGPEPPTKGKPR